MLNQLRAGEAPKIIGDAPPATSAPPPILVRNVFKSDNLAFILPAKKELAALTIAEGKVANTEPATPLIF